LAGKLKPKPGSFAFDALAKATTEASFIAATPFDAPPTGNRLAESGPVRGAGVFSGKPAGGEAGSSSDGISGKLGGALGGNAFGMGGILSPEPPKFSLFVSFEGDPKLGAGPEANFAKASAPEFDAGALGFTALGFTALGFTALGFAALGSEGLDSTTPVAPGTFANCKGVGAPPSGRTATSAASISGSTKFSMFSGKRVSL
jgi:hypothetical protein